MKFDNRVTRMLGVEIPIVQAPMGWIARAPLASAVSNAGGMGIIETSSGELDAIREEIRKMRELTDRPFGVRDRGSEGRSGEIAHAAARRVRERARIELIDDAVLPPGDGGLRIGHAASIGKTLP